MSSFFLSMDFAVRMALSTLPFAWRNLGELVTCEMVCCCKLSEGLCTIVWPVVWHYEIWNAMCGKNLLECSYDWMWSLIREFLDVKPPWVIVNHDDVFSSLKIIQVCCNPLPGVGWEGRRHKWFSGRWLLCGIRWSMHWFVGRVLATMRSACPGSTLGQT